MLSQLIREHALTEAQAGDWAAVAEILNALTQTVTVGKVGGKASLVALVAAGIDPNQVIAAMRANPMASELLNTLTADGVDWSDDMTAYVMGKLVAAGKISQQTVDVMQSLSVRNEAVIATTAEQCKSAWEYDQINLAWTTAQNDGGINAALAAGDRDALKTALTTLLESL